MHLRTAVGSLQRQLLLTALAVTPALAMDPPADAAAKGSAELARLATFDLDNFFDVDSPLAASPQARAFIEWRLGQWEREKASVRVLAEIVSEHYSEHARQTRADITYELRLRQEFKGHEEECISNGAGGALGKWVSGALLEFVGKTLPDSDRQVTLQKQQTDRYLRLLGNAIYDLGAFDLLSDLPSDSLYTSIDATAATLEELVVRFRLPRDKPLDVVQGMRTLNDCCKGLGEVNRFILTWLRQGAGRLKEDLAMLKANRDTPEQIRIPGEAPVESKLPEVVEVAEAVESKTEPAVERKLPAGSKGEQAFDGFQRFVACPERPRPVTAAFRVGKGAARIREQVEARAHDLSSSDVIRLVKALEPYGARCEEHRKKGIMLKLPAADPQVRFVAKFVHRSHASRDGLDCHSLDAVKEVFDASVFAIERFRGE